MMEPLMSKRRLACPQTIQHIWDAIVCIRQQKQIPILDRIGNYMRRKHGLALVDLERQISFALRDGLIRVTKKVGCKGSKIGIQQEGYRLPNNEVDKDGHDWYCFECHRGGEVCCCTTCHRVYHACCVKEDISTSENFQCAICKMCNSKNNFKLKRRSLNTLLTYTCNRLKEKVSEEPLRSKPQSRGVPHLEQTRDLHRMPHTEEEKWRHDLLLYHHIDLNAMENKAHAVGYNRLEEFQADAQSIVHNVVIYYGVHSPMADMARQMLRDCIYDLGEIRQCRDCYRMSNEKQDKFWFCQPCYPPHDLVYAKQKGFPYWPAKVIRQMNNVYDVRFFGGHHQRANIEKEHIKPITTNVHSLAVKRTVSWNRACEELRRHQEMLEKQKKELQSNGKSRPDDSDSDESEGEEVEKVTKETTEGKKKQTMSEKEVNVEEKLEPEVKISKKEKTKDKEKEKTKDKEKEKEKAKEKVKEQESEAEVSHDESSISSSSKTTAKQQKQEPTHEDYNVVSSSSQESTNTKVSVSTQTFRRLMPGKLPSRGVQTDLELIPAVCKCGGKSGKATKEKNEEDVNEMKDRIYKEVTEKCQREFEDQKQQAIAAAIAPVQKEIEKARRLIEEKLQREHQQELQLISERNRQLISDTKKKQWCYNCEAEAIYHCCWNTSYCSIECQQVHWQKEHKRNCRRKR